MGSLQENLTTDLKTWEMVRLASITRDVNISSINTVIFDDGVNGYLYSDIINEAYVLVPRGGNFDAMTQRIDTIFEESNEQLTSVPPKPTIGASYTYADSAYDQTPETDEDLPQNTINLPSIDEDYETNEDKVIVKNGTHVPGLAATTADALEAKGFTISYIGNTTERGWTTNTVYDFTKGKKIESLDKLSRSLNADIVVGASPESDANSAGVDFLVILGQEE